MPPAPIRRPVTITAWVMMSLVGLLFSPVLLGAGALAARILGRPQPRLLAQMMISYFAHELGVLAGAGGLWLWSGFGRQIHTRRFQLLHYRLLRWFVHGLAERVRTLLDIDVDADLSPEAAEALDADQPLLFFSRHAGPGDTLLLADLLVQRFGRHPSVVFKEALAIDPCIDLLGHRLPHAVLDTSEAEECRVRIQEVTAHLGPRGLLMLFPEGGNLTPERRARALRSLWRKGHRAQAQAGEQMTHVMPPHPMGALAALGASSTADVVFAAHTGLGLGAFPRQLWREVPMGRTLRVQMWVEPAAERPSDPDAQVEWLFEWWKRLDDWVGAQGEESAVETR